MKAFAAGLIVCLALASAPVPAQVHSNEDTRSCRYCGMDRQKFARSAMMIEYEDGTMAPMCSIHCAAVDLAVNIDKTPKLITVGDFNSKNQISAETACWTIGGDLPGVMTKRAKWAFENRADCEKFAREHGAQVATFDDAMKASYEDMYLDTKMIRDKRKMRRQKQQSQSGKQQR